ncbi:MAG: L-threonylcarbamoyladenylate synthase [Oligoflexia bacterium]|nr:L-threonylcarbamoyladenylate synthase [Oligoflexia bacterium]
MSEAITAKILLPVPANIALVAEALRQGEVIGMPTETVYGLAGAAFNASALARIFNAKERPTFDPLIVHVAAPVPDLRRLEELRLVSLEKLNAKAQKRANLLIAAFWPGPLTLVLPKQPEVPDLATSGLSTVGIRVPSHPVAQALLTAAGTPLAAPSANRFGRISPTSAAHVAAELGDRIEWILDGGPCEVGLESTVIAVAPDGELSLLRPGGIPRSEIERVAGAKLREPATQPAPRTGDSAGDSAGATAALSAPGNLESHYAPGKPLILLPEPISSLGAADLEPLLASFPTARKIGLLLLSGPALESASRFSALAAGKEIMVRVLSENGALPEIARNLFAEMRALDEGEAEVIFAEPCPGDQGLGYAIADRLKRASAKRGPAVGPPPPFQL